MFRFNYEDNVQKVENLYQLYGNLMYATAREVLKDSHLAQDAVHLSFERIMKNMHKVGDPNSPNTKNLVVIICKNISLDMLKKNAKYEQLSITEDAKFGPGPDIFEPDMIAINQDTNKELIDIINNLNTIYRVVIILRVEYELSYTQIADTLDINVETVRKRLYRAREMILKELTRRGYNE